MTKDWYIFAFIYRFLFYLGTWQLYPCRDKKRTQTYRCIRADKKPPKHTDEMFEML